LGFYYLCFGLAALATWRRPTSPPAGFGRALVAIRDAIAAEARASPGRDADTVFLFAGALAGIAAGYLLRCNPTSRLTPSLRPVILFFIAILIGGRGRSSARCSYHHLTVLPELAAPWCLVDFSLCRTFAGDRLASRRDRRPAGLQDRRPMSSIVR